MTDRAPERLACAVALVAAAAAATLVAGARRGGARMVASGEFQRVTGGLGSGPATSLSPCDAAFDAGSAACCAAALDPVPGGRAFCTHHAGPSLGR